MHINESNAGADASVGALWHEATNAILLQKMVQRSGKLSTMLVTNFKEKFTKSRISGMDLTEN